MSESASAASGSSERAQSGSAKSPKTRERGFFGRIVLFVRQVIGELKKVVKPTRTELFTFFVVVLVFVLAVMAYVGLIDLGFRQLVDLVFGT